MAKGIHFKTIETYYKENFGVEVETKSYDNRQTRETYNVIYEKGQDVTLVSKVNDGHFICLDSAGEIINGEKIFGVISEQTRMDSGQNLVFSEHDLVLHHEYEIIDVEKLIAREDELFPERTAIMLRGMFSRNGFSSDVTNFYVDKIVHVNEEQFAEIRRGDNSDVIKEFNKATYELVTDGTHGLLVIGPDGDGIMVDTQGYDYARYMSYAPKIEMPVNYILTQNMKQDAIHEMKLYVPLKVTQYGEDMEEEEIDGEPYARTIRGRVLEFNMEDGERGLASYFGKDNISREKVYSIKPDVERVRDTIMGVAIIKMTKPLTEAEIDDLKDYVTGQFADGWGESFEQREIQADGNEIYVHFWDHKDYYIKTEEELNMDMEQDMGMQGMGGMSGM